MDEICILLYRSIHDVMRSEAALRRAGIPTRLVPVPMAVAVRPEAVRSALEKLVSADSRPVSVHHVDSSGRIRPADPDRILSGEDPA